MPGGGALVPRLAKIFFHPLPPCAELDNLLRREMLLPGGPGGEVGEQNRNYLKEMRLTHQAIHDALLSRQTFNRSEADWVYLPTWPQYFFWLRSDFTLNCAKEWLENLEVGDRFGYDFLVNYGYEFPVYSMLLRMSVVLIMRGNAELVGRIHV